MFQALEQADWPAPGEVRDLRVSLNAPVLLAPDAGSQQTRAALGWIPDAAGPVVRVWLRAEDAPHAVRAFDLPERPESPAARATALERAERFLGGLGFLFAEAGRLETAGAPTIRELLAAPRRSPRTSDPGPASEPGAANPADVVAAVRTDVRLTKFRRRGPMRADRAAGGTEA